MRHPQIYVQIASYCDIELPKTIEWALSESKHPDRLTFGIVHQYDDQTLHLLDKYRGNRQFRIVEIPWQEACGVGEARRMCGDLWRDETYTLQVDAHTYFGDNWDEKLIEQWQLCGDDKAVLTSYPPEYDYDGDDIKLHEHTGANKIWTEGFFMGFIPLQKSFCLPTRKKPYRAAYFGAGLSFAKGDICKNLPYIREIAFTGEEIVRALQLFTSGYAIYTPNDIPIYHLYGKGRNIRKHIWSEMADGGQLKKAYDGLTNRSYELVKAILHGKHDEFLGKKHTIKQFEDFAGIDFRAAKTSRTQVTRTEPPYHIDRSS